MEKERRIKILSVVALIIAISGLTIAFAALSTTLTINGNAGVDSAKWDIHFDNLEVDMIYGSARENSKPTINKNKIENINVTITKPDDGIVYIAEIINDGTIDAEVDSVELSKLCTLNSPVESCDWNNDGVVTQEDIDKIDNNITFNYVVINEDEEEVHLKKSDILKKQSSSVIAIELGYWKQEIYEDGKIGGWIDSTELPARNLTFNNLSLKINYVQAD